MDILKLIGDASGMKDQLAGLGLSETNISDMSGVVQSQLGGGDGFDMTDLLSALDMDSFLSRIDVAAVAEKVGISPEIAQGAISLIAPKIAEFAGGKSGGLGGLVKGLFD